MKYLGALVLFCFLLLPFGCAITVNYDYDKHADFSRLKKYDWLPIPVKGEIGEARIQEIKKAIDAELAAKGLSISPDEPDFLVSAHMGKRDRTKRKDVKMTGGAGAGRVKEIPVEKVSLILEFMDAESKRVLWEGSANVKFEERPSPEKRDRQIHKAVKELMRKFPPPAS